MRYKFDFFVEASGIDPCDDCIELEIEISEKERQKILEAYDLYMWDEDVLKDLFDDYLQDLKQEIISFAMPHAIAKWGDKAKEENGARYYTPVPDDISDEYFESEAYEVFCSAQDTMHVNCRRQSKYEFNVLQDGVTSGRWPHFKKTPHWELFECASFIGGMKATYSMEGQCNGVKVDYCKRYTLKKAQMEIRLYGNMQYTNQLIEKHLRTCGRDITVKNMTFHHLVYIPSKEDESDIQIILPVLDQLENDSIDTINKSSTTR